MRFKIALASLIAGRKFTVFALFYFVFEGNFQVQASGGGLGLIHGGAYFRNFPVFAVLLVLFATFELCFNSDTLLPLFSLHKIR